MEPERKATIGNETISEYYWVGNMVVYVNNRLSPLNYDAAIKVAEARVEAQLSPEIAP